MGPIGSARYYCYEKEDDTWSASSRRINGFVPNNFFFSFFFQIVVHKCDRAKSTILKMFIFVATTKKKKSRNKHDPWNDDYAIKNLSFFFSILLPLVFINPANENAKYL